MQFLAKIKHVSSFWKEYHCLIQYALPLGHEAFSLLRFLECADRYTYKKLIWSIKAPEGTTVPNDGHKEKTQPEDLVCYVCRKVYKPLADLKCHCWPNDRH